ncbi:MAG: AAA family ATPase, partial [Euryarchaeota archaeon]|nr:AAA family ATPase [Euryarchaeota archaeon]
IAIKGPELLSKWVGESEKAVRETFKKARQSAPTIIFFDEIDSVASLRGQEYGTRVGERVLDQLLTEMDGLEELHNVIILAATNRPDLLDSALLRPGRFDRLLMVPLPDAETRLEILKVHTRDVPLAEDVDLDTLLNDTEGFTGADVEGLCREAAIEALREAFDRGEDIDGKKVEYRHFKEALKRVSPSVEKGVQESYEKFRERRRRVEAEPLGYMG